MMRDADLREEIEGKRTAELRLVIESKRMIGAKRVMVVDC